MLPNDDGFMTAFAKIKDPVIRALVALLVQSIADHCTRRAAAEEKAG